MRALGWLVAGLLIGLPALAIAAWMIAVPIESIEAEASLRLKEQGLAMTTRGLQKGLLFSLHAEELTLQRGATPVVTLSDISITPRLLSVLTTPTADISAHMAGGTLSGTVTKSALIAELTGAELEALALDRVGGKGHLSAAITLAQSGGKIEFSVRDAQLRPLQSELGAVPLELFTTLRGAITIRPKELELTALSLEGRDIYAKAAGKPSRGGLDLTIELMPTPSSMPERTLEGMFSQYKSGPGRYALQLHTP